MPRIDRQLLQNRKKPIATICIEAVFSALEWIHKALARIFTTIFTQLWRLQGFIPLNARFSIGFILVALQTFLVARILPIKVAADTFWAKLIGKWPELYFKWNEWSETNPEFIRYIEKAGKIESSTILVKMAIIGVALAILAAGLSWLRKSFTLIVQKIAWAYNFCVVLAITSWTFTIPKVLFAADNKTFDKLAYNELLRYTLFTVPFIVIIPLIVLVALLTIEARHYYSGQNASAPLFSTSRLLKSIKTGGDDPRFRTSCYWSVFLFLSVVVGPFLIFGCAGEEEYGIVKGSGEPELAQIVKVKPKKKQKKLFVDPWSPYILQRINIDDAKVLEELQEITQDTYQADRTKKGGKLGKGGKGNGGWPEGMEGAKVHFIRLKYNGGNWDQEMGKQGDYNLLIRFNQLTGLPVAPETESREISRLARFAKKKSPPFFFITGSGNINISSSEAKILRDYCLVEGGMLFIDCGGGHFGRSVRNMLAKVFPGKSLVDIPNDDPIYQQPYVFPDGAPRFWHHDGNRALGIRDEGRLVVFYHPGDIKDAWKEGHSGVTPEVADQAYKLGVNVIYYAFNQYYRRRYEQ